MDFDRYSICPTHYSLCYDKSSDIGRLVNWTFEGSCDGEEWILLQNHNGEIFNAYDEGTWFIKADRFYSKFRISPTSYNSNDDNLLSISRFEIYGNVVVQTNELSWNTVYPNKSKHITVDIR